MNAVDYLEKEVILKIDRPLGSRHLQYGFIYMLNYGYVPDTISGDGEELYVYLIGEFEPVKLVVAKLLQLYIGLMMTMISLLFLKMEMIIQMMQLEH